MRNSLAFNISQIYIYIYAKREEQELRKLLLKNVIEKYFTIFNSQIRRNFLPSDFVELQMNIF